MLAWLFILSLSWNLNDPVFPSILLCHVHNGLQEGSLEEETEQNVQ